jgi:hypothetical protein
MAVTTDRAYRQLLSASVAYRKPGIQELVYNSNPVIAAIRERGNVRSYTGPEIRHHLQINKQDAQWFTGYDKLRNPPIELFNDAVFTPTNIAVPISFNGTELLANQGRTRVINLMENYIDAAEGSMQDAMEIAIHSDGTGSNGRQMIGLGAALPIVDNTGTYGGINRATYSIWRTTTYDADTDFPDIGTQVDSTTIRPMYETIMAERSKGRRGADLLIASKEHYLAYSQSLVAHQRITSGGLMGRLGFTALEFAGAGKQAEVVLASGIGTSMPANTTYGLESESLYLYYHEDRNMDMLFDGDGAMPINQDAIANYLVWNGQFVLGNPQYSWRLIDSDTAS